MFYYENWKLSRPRDADIKSLRFRAAPRRATPSHAAPRAGCTGRALYSGSFIIPIERIALRVSVKFAETLEWPDTRASEGNKWRAMGLERLRVLNLIAARAVSINPATRFAM